MSPISAKLMPAPAAGPLTDVTIGQCRLRRRRRNGWKAISKRRASVAPARFLIVAALQIGAGAERAPRAGQNHAADLGFAILDGIERLAKTAEHVDRHRIHDLLMVELQDGHGAVDIERDVFELHLFPLGG